MMMDEFQRETLRRLPLAEAAWTLLRHVVSPEFTDALFEQFRGTGYNGGLSFSTLTELLTDALLEHRGSGRQSFERAHAEGRLTTTPRAVYGKLSRVPLPLSQALVLEGTRRAQQAAPRLPGVTLPPELNGYQVVAIDGKKIKDLAKRQVPLRAVSGRVLGGKAVVALSLNTHLVVAMETSPDGEANEAPLTPALIDQTASLFSEPILYLADRQFCDLTIPAKMSERGGRFVVRFSQKMGFFPEDSVTWRDSQGQLVTEEQGWLGSPRDARRLWVRRLTLERGPHAEAVAVVTNLLREEGIPGQALLDVYLQRWSIERVFQQVTEVFGLQKLVGSSPQGAIFQFAICLLLFNLLQIVRAYVAEDQACSAESVSLELLFRSTCDQLTAGALLLDRQELIQALDIPRSPVELRTRLQELLHHQWTPAWTKAPPKARPTPAPPKKYVPGGHSSAHKLIQAAKQTKKKKAPS
jgi:hypothetical protein